MLQRERYRGLDFLISPAFVSLWHFPWKINPTASGSADFFLRCRTFNEGVLNFTSILWKCSDLQVLELHTTIWALQVSGLKNTSLSQNVTKIKFPSESSENRWNMQDTFFSAPLHHTPSLHCCSLFKPWYRPRYWRSKMLIEKTLLSKNQI